MASATTLKVAMAAVLAAGLAALPAAAQGRWGDDLPLPQDALWNPQIPVISAKRKDIRQAMVVVEMGLGPNNPQWVMGQTHLQVFLDKLETMPDRPLPEDDIWPKLKAPDARYKGIRVVIEMLDGKNFAPITIYEGRVTDPEKVLISPDFGRRLEYWMFGTARIRRDQLIGVNVLPVVSFEQCRLLGQRIVETTPRQCLLPDNNLLLETTEQATLTSARIRTFDECLKNGVSLIYTFPRRCVAAGGRVFTEPARVYEPPTLADAPLARPAGDVTGSLGGLKVVTPTAPVSPVSSAPVSATAPLAQPAAAGPLSDADLARIAPAAGPARRPAFKRSVHEYEWADFWRD